jgi:hypothetical protein
LTGTAIRNWQVPPLQIPFPFETFRSPSSTLFGNIAIKMAGPTPTDVRDKVAGMWKKKVLSSSELLAMSGVGCAGRTFLTMTRVLRFGHGQIFFDVRAGDGLETI